MPRRGDRQPFCCAFLEIFLFRLERPPADVAAAEATRPVDRIDSRIGARLRFGEGRAEAGDVQHPATIGEQAAPLTFRPRLRDDHARQCRGLVEATDFRALLRCAGIALGGKHDSQRMLRRQAKSFGG